MAKPFKSRDRMIRNTDRRVESRTQEEPPSNRGDGSSTSDAAKTGKADRAKRGAR